MSITYKFLKLCEWTLCPTGGWMTGCGFGFEGVEPPEECPHCGKSPFDVTDYDNDDD